MKRPFVSREVTLVVAGFVLLTIVLTYPQIRFMSSRMGEHYDSLFSVWRLAWIAHQLPRDPLHLFDGNIFYPRLQTLAYSDAVLLPGVLGAPLIWIGLSPVLVHNLLVLFSFAACGVAMYLLCRELTGSPVAACVGGIVFAFQPYRFAHYPQLELLWGWPIPLAFLATHRVVTMGRVRDGVWLGVAVSLQVFCCLYYAVFLVTSLVVLLAVLLIGRRREDILRVIRPGLAACAVAALLAAPYVLPYLEIGNARSAQEIEQWSPTLANYVAVPPQNWVYGHATGSRSLEGVLFPGIAAVVLAVAGLTGSLSRCRVAYLALLLVAFDMSLGSHGWLYGGMYRTIPVYRSLRVPGRMFVIVSAGLAVLAADGVQRVMAFVRAPRLSSVAGAALAAIVLLESATIPMDLKRVPRLANMYAWLEAQPRSVVMEWPMPRPSSLGLTHEPFFMYASTRHWQPLVNGYSGFYPLSYIHFLENTEEFPSPAVIEYLRAASVRYVLLHSELDPGGYVDARVALSGRSDIELVSEERDGLNELALYRIGPK